MNDLRRTVARIALQYSDTALMLFSLLVATYTTYHQGVGITFEDFLTVQTKAANFIILLLLVLVWRLLFALCGLYRSNRMVPKVKELGEIITATSVGSIVFLFMGKLFNIRLATPLFLIVFWSTNTLLVVASRVVLRYILKKVRLKGRNLRHVLVVGTNQRAVQFARQIDSRPELGYHILGFVENGWSGNRVFKDSGYQIVADFKGLPDFLRSHVIDEVVVCLPLRSLYELSSRVVELCEEQGITVRVLSDLFNLKLARPNASSIGEDTVITIRSGAMTGWPVLGKRLLDFAISLVVLIVFLPLFLVIAVLIKLTSPGPIFFIQDRVGLNKRIFRLYKFRTMIPDAEKKITELEEQNEMSGPVFKIKNDPRITWIGKYLRKSSLDELPQLLNVLKGDMSMVGPRPLPVRDYQGFDKDWQRRRFSVRPGITCLWQIAGRSSIGFERWMELDMDYIDHWSLALDFKILFKTIPAVLKGSGAA